VGMFPRGVFIEETPETWSGLRCFRSCLNRDYFINTILRVELKAPERMR